MSASDDRPLKSAYELAMERLREADREAGIEESAPLSDAQKDEIAELRREAEARLAEIDILKQSRVAEAGGDPAKIVEVEEAIRVDRERIRSRLDDAIARVRSGRSGRLDD